MTDPLTAQLHVAIVYNLPTTPTVYHGSVSLALEERLYSDTHISDRSKVVFFGMINVKVG